MCIFAEREQYTFQVGNKIMDCLTSIYVETCQKMVLKLSNGAYCEKGVYHQISLFWLLSSFSCSYLSV